MADNIISSEAFNATETDHNYIRNDAYSYVFASRAYKAFTTGAMEEYQINNLADILYKNGEIGDSLVFVLEYVLSLKSTDPKVRQNIINNANRIRQKYLEIAAKAWQLRNKNNLNYSIYLSSLNKTPHILGDVRQFCNFRDAKLRLDVKNSKFQDGNQRLPSPRNYLMSTDDFYFAKPLPGLKQKEGIQPIIINEFQPEVMYYADAWASHLGVDIARVSGISKVIDEFKKTFNSSIVLVEKYMNSEKSNNALKKYSAKPDLLYNKKAYENTSSGKDMHPVQMLKQMFNTR